MRISFLGGDISGSVEPPPSKSHTHRAFVLSSLADGPSVVRNPLMSTDTVATLKALREMGAEVGIGGGVEITGGNLRPPDGALDVGNSGTALRFLTAVASLFDAPVTITGDDSVRGRPMGPLLEALGELNVECTSDGGRPPVTVKGPNVGGKTSVEGSASSQFLSALMIAAPLSGNDTEIAVSGNLASAPYVEITSSAMRRYGAEITRNGNAVTVSAGGYVPCEYDVPADFSSAAFPLVAGALGGSVTVPGLDMGDSQGDKAIIGILEKAGAKVSFDMDAVRVESGKLSATDLDLGRTPDLFPIVAVLLSVAEGESRLHGAPHLKFKETDRIKSTIGMLRALGADVSETVDGCVIRGKKRLSGGFVDHRGDHRIMMSAAVASLVCENPVTMEDTGCHSVSYPGFIEGMVEAGLVNERGIQ